MLTWSIIAIIFLTAWITADFYFGKKQHQRTTKQTVFPERHSTVHFFADGDDFFKAFLRDITDAEHHIHVLFYIFREDTLGHRVIEHLAKKVKQGVSVRLLVDYIGSHGLSKKTIQHIKKLGIEFSYSNKPKLPFLFYTLNQCNHRKITVIDGKIGYMGGFNVGDEYLGKDAALGDWRDYHLRLTEEGVKDLQVQFAEDWERATHQKLTHPSFYPTLSKGSTSLQIIPTNGMNGDHVFLKLIQQAKQSILIGSPYFIPGKAIQEALIEKVKSGVAVKLLLPMKSDHILVQEAAFPYFQPLLYAGVEIYRFYQGFYHSKVCMIDNEICDIGTANFDQRSFHINFEVNCIIRDKRVINTVSKAVEWDIYRSEKLTLDAYENRPLLHRSKEQVALLMSKLL
ncbi:cardiolipin synthase [Bacillus taeanensis]|uniref:Cardiolipin synthase n=1 Tax=Bacillus taeanensis TaxID=273032 RepID=A0A366XQQ3_9BACI|nr:cardiolipin synthase [Bacillus taeanensis]RBW68680.1 cardiolipin synthase [Bacillus taeanensis]